MKIAATADWWDKCSSEQENWNSPLRKRHMKAVCKNDTDCIGDNQFYNAYIHNVLPRWLPILYQCLIERLQQRSSRQAGLIQAKGDGWYKIFSIGAMISPFQKLRCFYRKPILRLLQMPHRHSKSAPTNIPSAIILREEVWDEPSSSWSRIPPFYNFTHQDLGHFAGQLCLSIFMARS